MLSDEDKSHMWNLGYGGMMRAVTPDDVAERLTSQGRARPTTGGGLVLTEAGYMALGKPGKFVEMGKK